MIISSHPAEQLTLSPSQSQELSTQKGLSLQENSVCLQVRLVVAASLPPQFISSPPSRQSERTLSGQQEDKTCQPAKLTSIRGGINYGQQRE